MKKLFKNWTRSIVAGIAGIAALISIGFITQSSNEVISGTSKNKIKPPLKNVDIEYKNYSINAQRGLKIRYFETGSVITIPDSAFVDAEGEIIEGKVDIKYREFHDPVDFFVSGIPMTYDSAGEKYHFESAGMLEMLAFQYGKPVFLNPEKRITIEMLSKQTEDKFNIYKFNPLQGNWKYIHKDKAIPVNQPSGDNIKNSLFAAGNRMVNANSNDELIAPEKSDTAKYHFDIAVDSVEFPELTTYKGTLFEVDKKEKDFNPLYASATWNDISLEKGKQEGCYLMTLSKGAESHTFQAKPVLGNSDYDKALEVYKSKMKVRKNKEKLLQRLRDSLFVVLNRKRVQMNDTSRFANFKMFASQQTDNEVVRVFSISGFGLWNSDCPSSLPKGEHFAASYKDSLGNSLEFTTVHLVEKGRNAMFTIYTPTSISFNPKKRNCMWAVTKDNKLAVFDEKNFKKLQVRSGKAALTMTLIDLPLVTVENVKSVLKI